MCQNNILTKNSRGHSKLSMIKSKGQQKDQQKSSTPSKQGIPKNKHLKPNGSYSGKALHLGH